VTQFSFGIGLTNECNLRCAHCYRPDMVVERLTLDDIRRVIGALPARSVNLGVGENGLHPQYAAILDEIAARGIRTSITSNGQSIAVLPDAATASSSRSTSRRRVSTISSAERATGAP